MRSVSHHANSSDGGVEDTECHVTEIKFHPHTAFLSSHGEQRYESQIMSHMSYPLLLFVVMIDSELSASVCLITLASEYCQVCFQRKLFKLCNRPQ